VKHDVALHVRAAVMKPSRRLTLNVRLIPQLLLALGQNLDLPPGLRLLLPELGDLLALGDVLPDGVGQAQRDRADHHREDGRAAGQRRAAPARAVRAGVPGVPVRLAAAGAGRVTGTRPAAAPRHQPWALKRGNAAAPA